MDAFWNPCGTIFGPFWSHVEFRNRLGSFLRAVFRLEGHFLASTPTVFEGFGKVSGSILKIFCCLWSMLISSCTSIRFSNDFSLIIMPSGQAKVGKVHRRSCKNLTFVLFAIECVWESILEGFWILGLG